MWNREDWTPLHHLAYVYAAVASVDGSITNEELEVLCHKLHQWNAGIDAAELMKIVMTAVSALGTDKERRDVEPLHVAIGIVAGALDADGRAAALDDLLSIAGADGAFASGEGELLLTIKRAWETDAGAERSRDLPKDESS
jgi:uncharacterized tellurite resistance protein B-like protein